jgi:hypothetical protein
MMAHSRLKGAKHIGVDTLQAPSANKLESGRSCRLQLLIDHCVLQKKQWFLESGARNMLHLPKTFPIGARGRLNKTQPLCRAHRNIAYGGG